ncbi:UDP-3-O-(3-hydroxymyristoyl)glucosamine N-acyltransferase [Pseudohongiella spirulinae]|uniref:UDP-3-O-acylglucosamine N-acyltransferase n=1 Tax=Pseudohongiella spirulinae TaxID=1249552 RepID=A0A0S2KDH8_9GAMM|nr:UDP-3-O-(3-hydroxymyristoyl)glucosamine N-acyltransferase [Pseudohongiella spirulinae]ALO46047.1 UDP-3-O-acylglucosamine N-acyltransferase [Pseudohongiella spirulinae]
MASITLAELAQNLGLALNEAGHKASELQVVGLATLASAGQGQLSFLSNPKYASQLPRSNASAFIVTPEIGEQLDKPCLLSESPYLAYAHASQLFAGLRVVNTDESALTGVHPSAVISAEACIGDHVRIGPHAVIESGVVIGSHCSIGAGVSIGANAVLGDYCRLNANVVLYDSVHIGDRVTIHSGSVIGADGFGYAFDGQKSVKIAQLGSVFIGSDVEIGAGTTIDRGALDDTRIGNGVKIDNQVQIGHNCTVGDHTVICGCTALAGSTHVGRYCLIGGGVGITGHLSIVDKVSISAMSMVSKSIDKPGVYASGALVQESTQWRRNAVALTKLAGLSKTVRQIEKRLTE